jgi:ATP-dependent DNA helicase DinG
MRCVGCGNSVIFNDAPEDRLCLGCGKELRVESDDYLLHGAGGLVREIRTGQINMGRLVEKIIQNESIGIVEGPVGIGKSFGYAVPALLAGNKRIVISTAKKQLQHQLARKDIPMLGEKLEQTVQVALLKGKNNYACRVKAFDVPKEHQEDFIKWLDESEFADLTDYPGKRPYFWGDVTAEDCIGTKCKFAHKCGYWKAKQQTKTARVIIANHHVVAFDLRFGPRKMLGAYDVLIIDEAHQAPAAFRGAFAIEVTPFSVKRMLRQIDKAGLNTGLEKRLEDAWEAMFKQVSALEGEVPKDPFGVAGDDALALLGGLSSIVKKEMAEAGYVSAEDMEETDENQSSEKVDWESVAKLEMLRKSVDRSLEALSTAKEPDENTVVYVTTTERKYKKVTVSPISVGPMIGSKWQSIPTTLITSATIAINGDFSDIKRQLGLDWKPAPALQAPSGPVSMTTAAQSEPIKVKQIEELVLETPFDYKKQALLFAPKDVPLPEGPIGDWSTLEQQKKRNTYIATLTAHCARLLRIANGNAFILFTSNQDLKDVHDFLLEEDLDLTLIPQGDDAEAAFKKFMATPRSVILGNKSFWEGVDVQGDKLRLVIVTKLPFPLVSDPVVQARTRQIVKAGTDKGLDISVAQSKVFTNLQIPSMITDLRQGAGRLIRSKTDKGVLAILDCRIWTGNGKRAPTEATKSYAGYGIQVINALGFSQRTSDISIVERKMKEWFKDE